MASMFSSPKPTPAPAAPAAVRVPNETDSDHVAGMRKKMQDMYQRKEGRASTDLTPDTSKPYSRTMLG